MPQPADDNVLRSRLKLIQDAVACSEEEALMALEGADGDVHSALKLLDLITKDILVIKFRFEGRRAVTVSGVGYVAANTRSGKLLTVDSVVTYRASLADEVTPDLPWRIVDTTIDSLRLSSDINLNATMDLDAQISAEFQPWRIDELGRMANEGRVDELVAQIDGELSRCLKENLRVEVSFERLTRVQFEEQIERDQAHPVLPDMEQSDQEAGNGLTIFLQSELYVAPVDGRPVETLAPGMSALVRIVDQSQIGTYLATLLGARNGPEMVPLAAPVTRVEELASGRLRVEFRYGPGVMGKAICDHGVKVRIIDHEPASPSAPARIEWTVIAVVGLLLLLMSLLLHFR